VSHTWKRMAEQGPAASMSPRLPSAVRDVVPDAGRVGPLHGATTGRRRVHERGLRMSTILLIILILLLIGALPTWPYSSGWGYYPSGGLGLVLLVILILALTGRL
jgi:hypothetical protein